MPTMKASSCLLSAMMSVDLSKSCRLSCRKGGNKEVEREGDLAKNLTSRRQPVNVQRVVRIRISCSGSIKGGCESGMREELPAERKTI